MSNIIRINRLNTESNRTIIEERNHSFRNLEKLLHCKTHEPREESNHHPTPHDSSWPCVQETVAEEGNYSSEQRHGRKRYRQAFEKCLHTQYLRFPSIF